MCEAFVACRFDGVHPALFVDHSKTNSLLSVGHNCFTLLWYRYVHVLVVFDHHRNSSRVRRTMSDLFWNELPTQLDVLH
jgi:hypothetical protein